MNRIEWEELMMYWLVLYLFCLGWRFEKKINIVRVCFLYGWFEVCDKDLEFKEKGR